MSKLIIDLEKIRHNLSVIKRACDQRDLKLNAVLKSCQLLPEVVYALIQCGIERMSFSGPVGFAGAGPEKLPHITLLKMPAPSGIDSVVRYANSSVNSEIGTVKQLADAAARDGLCHEIVVMVDLGDRREGILPNEIGRFSEQIRNLLSDHIVFSGIGVNFGCLSSYCPSDHEFSLIDDLVWTAQKIIGYRLPRISIGGSILLDRVLSDGYLGMANELRVGEAIFLGTSPGRQGAHTDLFDDAFVYSGEILEIKDKPRHGDRRNTGTMKRAVVNFGSLNTVPEGLHCLDHGARYVGNTSDYTVFDVTQCERSFKTGDVLRFIPDYEALAQCLISPYNLHEIRDHASSTSAQKSSARAMDYATTVMP
ncbi:alanine racemase [Burkholderia cenocepacia]|uniref:alanine racemase n=1 Tax=Burkholderia cenocepacia TaxID=95486 RepID=UPI0028573318|nr:alanine racemase [Burkholderia cenocepacia]MDR8038781.1 alanine racemase [Burkholderia cenocepacia]